MSHDLQKVMSDNHPSVMIDRPSAIIDQLVCGELRGEAYRNALQLLDANPQHWRACALAFLQEQAIEQELRQMANESIEWCSNRSLPIAGTGEAHLSFSTEDPVRVVSTEHKYWRTASRVAAKLTGLAALLLISFGFGWMASKPERNSLETVFKDSTQPESGMAPLTNQQHLAYDGTNAQNGSIRTVGRRDHDYHDSWAISDAMLRNNPALVGNLSSRLLPIDQRIPDELLELQRQGRVRIESSSSLMPIEQKNGASVLVPVQQYQIVPIVFSY